MSTLSLRIEWRPWAKWLFIAMKAAPWISSPVVRLIGVDRFTSWLVRHGVEFKL